MTRLRALVTGGSGGIGAAVIEYLGGPQLALQVAPCA